MKRDIKKENRMVREIFNHVADMYIEKVRKTGHRYENFVKNVYLPINNGTYPHLDNDEVMGEYNRYVQQFSYEPADEKKIDAIDRKLLKFFNIY